MIRKILILSLFLLTIAPSIQAHKGATGIVKERMDSMKEMKDAMEYLSDTIKGDIAFNPASAQRATRVLQHNSQNTLDYFPNTPDSRDSRVSEARDDIWREWPRFETKANESIKATIRLNIAMEQGANPKELRSLVKDVANSCKSCHRDYKKD